MKGPSQATRIAIRAFCAVIFLLLFPVGLAVQIGYGMFHGLHEAMCETLEMLGGLVKMSWQEVEE